MVNEESPDRETGIFFSAGLVIPFDKLVGLVIDEKDKMYNQVGLIVEKDLTWYRLRFLSDKKEWIDGVFSGLNNPFCQVSAETGRRQIEVYSRDLGSGFYMALMKELGRSPINLLARMEAQGRDKNLRAERYGKQLRELIEKSKV